MQLNRSKIKEKFLETLKAVFPIIAIVLLLCFTIAPIEPSIVMAFLIGAVLLIVGMMLFSIGAEMAMTPMGERDPDVDTITGKILKLSCCYDCASRKWVIVCIIFISHNLILSFFKP